jgi:hypothetical protein
MKTVLIQEQAEMLQRLDRELHDLCQPLTALQCRLELAAMCGDEVSLMEGVKGSSEDMERLFVGIGTMREQLQREMARVRNSKDAGE